ncbi:MAG: hypothetical protein U0X39_16425 [Bacteroidales bacterium]
MKRLIILLVVLALAFSCKKVEKEPLGPTDIRIRNLSTSNMTSLKISTGGGEHEFGNLPGVSTTDYFRFEKAYPKANIYAVINGQVYKTDTAIYTYMQYLGKVKATYEIFIKSDAQKKLEISNVILDAPLE